mmetsp:Transcript_6617/g.8277  ORF Transcript_6617/g.8277 Transcript_6617/m.8277 type:complete len:80 (-) Transcript_6617:23-262(-)
MCTMYMLQHHDTCPSFNLYIHSGPAGDALPLSGICCHACHGVVLYLCNKNFSNNYTCFCADIILESLKNNDDKIIREVL